MLTIIRFIFRILLTTLRNIPDIFCACCYFFMVYVLDTIMCGVVFLYCTLTDFAFRTKY